MGIWLILISCYNMTAIEFFYSELEVESIVFNNEIEVANGEHSVGF